MAREVMRLMQENSTAGAKAVSASRPPKGDAKKKAKGTPQRQPLGNTTAPQPRKSDQASSAKAGEGDANSTTVAVANASLPRAMRSPNIVGYETEAIELWDQRNAPGHKPALNAPVVHIVRGLGTWLPFLRGEQATPIVCVADWQYDPATQRHFWEQAVPLLEDACGGPEVLARALMIVAGDMASLSNELRGVASDSVPELEPFTECLGREGAMFFVYGNHDDEVPRVRRNANGLSQLLPDGEVVDTGRGAGAVLASSAVRKQRRWGRQADATAAAAESGSRQPAAAAEEGSTESQQRKQERAQGLTIGGVHGIPSARPPIRSPWKKRDRSFFFQQVRKVCEADIAVLHQNVSLPDLKTGPDGGQVLDIFTQGRAPLLVHGHFHMERVVSIVEKRQVIVHADNRVVVLLLDTESSGDRGE